MRKPHYWKTAGAKLAPSNILCFDTETWHGERATVQGGELHRLRLGVALAYRLEHSRRTRVKELCFKDRSEFIQLLETRMDKSRPLWVFAHNLAYDAGVVGLWKWVRQPGVNCEKCAVSGSLFFMRLVTPHGVVILCDTLNYYRTSLAKLGKAIGKPKMVMPGQDEPDSVWAAYCANDTEVTAGAVDHLISFNRAEELGPWQPSIAGLAFSGYRRRFMKHKVLVHTYRRPLALERQAYYGGLVDTPFIGKAPASSVWELDVCSMYPAVCQQPLPVKIVNGTANADVSVVKHLAKKFLLCADVTLATTDEPYPVKCKAGTFYPLGRYRTALAHPELMLAVERGHVEKVHFVSWYTSGFLFKDYMRHFAAKKIAYSKSNTEAFETLCKYFMTNLYGKTGQMSPKWVQWGAKAMALLEEKYGLPPNSLVDTHTKPPDLYELHGTYSFRAIPEPIEIRDFYGVVEVKVGEHESRDSCPIIAATVTSYARCLLRKFQAIAGWGNWFYSDTDSIWTNDKGKRNLEAAGCVKEEVLGFLSVEREHKWLVVHGPKDYETDTVRKLKGIRAGTKPAADGSFTQLHFPSAAKQIQRGEANGVFCAHVTKRLARTLTKSAPLPDGFTRPLVFPMESPDVIALTKGKRATRRNRKDSNKR